MVLPQKFVFLCRILSLLVLAARAQTQSQTCEVRTNIDTGYVCGKLTTDSFNYALFRGIPYAKQPTGQRRFKELEPLDPWTEDFYALTEGPSCHQNDRLYGSLLQPQGYSEECIHVNIAAPAEYLPNVDDDGNTTCAELAPILVFIHGGAAESGSGDWDWNGPQFFFPKKAVVITFNYRLNVFGFMSLNSSSIPGNQALRDMVTLLKWVQRNANSFGGDPDNVTLMGQSYGGQCTHLLALSSAAEGLFKRVILMSGTALPSVGTFQPAYSNQAADIFLAQLNITATDPEEIHNTLIDLDIDTIMNAYYAVQDTFGLKYFTPVVESKFDGVTQILDDYPENLLNAGRGKDIPAIIGYTSNECAGFGPRLQELMVVNLTLQNPTNILAPGITFAQRPFDNATLMIKAEQVIDRYTHGANITFDTFLEVCKDQFLEYVSLKTAQIRAARGAPTYVYKFGYEGQFRVYFVGLNTQYDGVGHTEDLSYIFKYNSVYNETTAARFDNAPDQAMRNWMVSIVYNFMTCGTPSCSDSDWPATVEGQLQYQNIITANQYDYVTATSAEQDMFSFYDQVYNYTYLP